MMSKYLKNDKGQGVMEYLIITSLIGIFCLVVVKNFGQVVQTRIEHMKEDIVEHIKID